MFHCAAAFCFLFLFLSQSAFCAPLLPINGANIDPRQLAQSGPNFDARNPTTIPDVPQSASAVPLTRRDWLDTATDWYAGTISHVIGVTTKVINTTVGAALGGLGNTVGGILGGVGNAVGGVMGGVGGLMGGLTGGMNGGTTAAASSAGSAATSGQQTNPNGERCTLQNGGPASDEIANDKKLMFIRNWLADGITPEAKKDAWSKLCPVKFYGGDAKLMQCILDNSPIKDASGGKTYPSTEMTVACYDQIRAVEPTYERPSTTTPKPESSPPAQPAAPATAKESHPGGGDVVDKPKTPPKSTDNKPPSYGQIVDGVCQLQAGGQKSIDAATRKSLSSTWVVDGMTPANKIAACAIWGSSPLSSDAVTTLQKIFNGADTITPDKGAFSDDEEAYWVQRLIAADKGDKTSILTALLAANGISGDETSKFNAAVRDPATFGQIINGDCQLRGGGTTPMDPKIRKPLVAGWLNNGMSPANKIASCAIFGASPLSAADVSALSAAFSLANPVVPADGAFSDEERKYWTKRLGDASNDQKTSILNVLLKAEDIGADEITMFKAAAGVPSHLVGLKQDYGHIVDGVCQFQGGGTGSMDVEVRKFYLQWLAKGMSAANKMVACGAFGSQPLSSQDISTYTKVFEGAEIIIPETGAYLDEERSFWTQMLTAATGEDRTALLGLLLQAEGISDEETAGFKAVGDTIAASS